MNRCVADEQRTLALGLQSIIFRVIGNVPGPIVFGVIFDISCVFWNYEIPCGATQAVRGACWEYDNNLLSISILSMVLITVGINFVFSLSWLAYPKANVSDPTNELALKEDVNKDF